mmetsp:Transcript_22429/g.55255  ORF Transcript_22429/g.55255 Transcript_22429/m.55255 type:complete len:98 (+) Transcript_22429:44-337(+)
MHGEQVGKSVSQSSAQPTKECYSSNTYVRTLNYTISSDTHTTNQPINQPSATTRHDTTRHTHHGQQRERERRAKKLGGRWVYVSNAPSIPSAVSNEI